MKKAVKNHAGPSTPAAPEPAPAAKSTLAQVLSPAQAAGMKYLQAAASALTGPNGQRFAGVVVVLYGPLDNQSHVSDESMAALPQVIGALEVAKGMLAHKLHCAVDGAMFAQARAAQVLAEQAKASSVQS